MIVLIGELREELNEKLDLWRQALKVHGCRISRSKTEYKCNFSKRRTISNLEVRIRDNTIPQVT